MNEFLQILGVYSVKDVIAIVAVVLLTSLVKIPIKRAASKYAEGGGNKALINSLIVFICVVNSFAAAILIKLIENGWDWGSIPWAEKASDVLPQWAIVFVGASTLYAILWQSLEKGIGAAFQAVVKAIQGGKAGEEAPKETVEIIPTPAIVAEAKPTAKAKEAQRDDGQASPMKPTR